MSGKQDGHNERFELDIPFDEAIARFARVTKEELAAETPSAEGAAALTDGETEIVPFKGTEIRKVFHNRSGGFQLWTG